MVWTLDQSSGDAVWKCSSYADLNYAEINNLAEIGQPRRPGESGHVSGFVPNFGKVIVEMPQAEVMTKGYGGDIDADTFPIVERFLNEKLTFAHGTYSFDDLVLKGFAKPGDKRIGSNLYGWGGKDVQTGSISAADAAYIHGTVSFALMSGTRFIYSRTLRRVEAEIGAGDDNWDFNSSSIPKWVNATVAKVLGPEKYNLTAPIEIRFRGHGKRSNVQRVTTSP